MRKWQHWSKMLMVGKHPLMRQCQLCMTSLVPTYHRQELSRHRVVFCSHFALISFTHPIHFVALADFALQQQASTPQQGPTITITYQTGWNRAFLHYNVDGKGAAYLCLLNALVPAWRKVVVCESPTLSARPDTLIHVNRLDPSARGRDGTWNW